MYHSMTMAAPRRVSNEEFEACQPPSPSVRSTTTSTTDALPRRHPAAPSHVETGEITAHGNVRKLVEHNYHDHSRVPVPSLPAPGSAASDNDSSSSSLVVTRGGNATVFPLKLYGMLDDAASADPSRDRQLPGMPDGHLISHIVCFQPHGRAFKVQNVALFKQHVLPVYFGKMKYSSFLRQLNLYGFTRLYKGADKGGYYHELFLQNRPHLICRIQRMKIKGSGTRAAANPDQEPNFYAMPYMRDVPVPGEGSMASPSSNTAVQTTSEPDDDEISIDMLFEPFPFVPSSRMTYRQVSMTSGDLMDSQATLDSFHVDLGCDEGDDDDDDMAVAVKDLDLDLALLDDLDLISDGEDQSSSEEESASISTQEAVAPSPTASGLSPVASEPTPLAVPPFLMSHAAAAQYTAAASTATSIPPVPKFDTSEISFLKSLFAPADLAQATAKQTSMDNATNNAQADYRNHTATNGGRSRFQNTRAARTA